MCTQLPFPGAFDPQRFGHAFALLIGIELQVVQIIVFIDEMVVTSAKIGHQLDGTLNLTVPPHKIVNGRVVYNVISARHAVAAIAAMMPRLFEMMPQKPARRFVWRPLFSFWLRFFGRLRRIFALWPWLACLSMTGN